MGQMVHSEIVLYRTSSLSTKELQKLCKDKLQLTEQNGMLSTVDLLVLTSLNWLLLKLKNIIFHFYKTSYPNEEVTYTESFPSVSLWAFGALGLWAFGPLGLWEFGPLGLWAFGPFWLFCIFGCFGYFGLCSLFKGLLTFFPF
jgi:hypothetical protein